MLDSSISPRLFDIYTDKERIYLAMENAGKRTLKAFLSKYETQISVTV